MSNKSRKILFEDLVTFQDKWATGISGRSVGPQSVTLLDLLKKGVGDNQHPNNAQASGVIPHGAEMLVELLGDLIHQSVLVKQALKMARSNPVLDGRPKAKAQLNKIIRRINIIHKIIRFISKDIDNFSIEKSDK